MLFDCDISWVHLHFCNTGLTLSLPTFRRHLSSAFFFFFFLQINCLERILYVKLKD